MPGRPGPVRGPGRLDSPYHGRSEHLVRLGRATGVAHGAVTPGRQLDVDRARISSTAYSSLYANTASRPNRRRLAASSAAARSSWASGSSVTPASVPRSTAHTREPRPGEEPLVYAAHLMSPFAGAGANLALLDGAGPGLALTAAHPGDVEAALSAYEERLLPRSERSAAESARSAALLFRGDAPQGPLDEFAAHG